MLRGLSRSTVAKKPCNGNSSVHTQTPRPVAEEHFDVMPPRKPWERRGPRRYRHGPYTQVNPASKKVKPKQERERFKVQALTQLDAIGLRAVNAELNTMAWARNQQIWLGLDQPHSTRMHCEIVDHHGEPLVMNNHELYWVMVQINWTLKTPATTNMQI